MASIDADLICGGCTNLLRDPYSLPCGHTFCLRPCLLPHAKAATSRCIHCDATFNASQLRPNYSIGARLYLLSSQQEREWKEEEQNQRPKKQVEGNAEREVGMLTDGKETSEKPRIHIVCRACKRTIEAKSLDICQHCHCNICFQCREEHHESCRSIIRARLYTLFRHKATLISCSERLQKSKTSLLKADKKMKDELLGSLEGVVNELLGPAGKSLDSSVAKLKTMYKTDYETLNPLMQRIRNLIAEADRAQDVSASLEGITSLQEIAEKQNSLKKLILEAAALGEMMKDLPPLPITQMRLSGLFNKIDRHMSDFRLFMRDEANPPSQPFHCSGTGEQSGSITTIFVGGLRPSHTESQLCQYFSQYGTVTRCHILKSRRTGESRGFGFVTFQEAAEASRAFINSQHFIEGNSVQVNPAVQQSKKESKKETKEEKEAKKKRRKEDKKKREEMAFSVSTTKAAASSSAKTGHQLIVHDLPLKTRKMDIRRLLGGFGTITSVKVDQAEHKAFVSFSTAEALQTAVEAAPHHLRGVDLRVSSPGDPDLSCSGT
ncbi:DAZ-associated protein 1 [Taenia crassiceps]|uniref:DAZ-associated protein 1 n=1 Tax=Taenia crassiceps TaxID=6207 RepID=A0ABR4Q1U7_9CEST